MLVFGVFGEACGDVFSASDLGFVLTGVEHPIGFRPGADGFLIGCGAGAAWCAMAESAGRAEAGWTAALLESLVAHGGGRVKSGGKRGFVNGSVVAAILMDVLENADREERADHRGSTCGEQGQRNACHRHQCDVHTDVYEDVSE